MTSQAPAPPESPHRARVSDILPADGGGLTLNNIIRLLLKHAFWVLVFVILGPIIAAFWVNRQVKYYEASTTILYDFSQPNTLGRSVQVYDPYSDYYNKQELMETEFRVVTSMRVMRQVVVDMGLDVDRAFLAAVFPGAKPEQIKPETIADMLRGRTKVEPVRGTHIAKVSFEDTDPARAQRLVAAIVDAYIRTSSEDAVGSTGTALEFLTGQVKRLEDELRGSEMQLHTFKKRENLLSVSLKDQNNLLREEISALNSAVTSASIKRSQLVARANALSKVTRANPDELPAAEFLGDAMLSTLRAQFQQARTELSLLKLQGKLDKHPDVTQAQERLDRALDQFINQVRNLQAAALREASVVTTELGSLKGLLEQSKKRALEINELEISYNQLQRAANTNEKLYSNVLERLKEVDISRMVSVKNIKVLDAPQLPVAPVRPKVPNVVGVGVGAGLFLGLLVAVLRELADRTVKTPADLETKIGVTSLGLLPETDAEAPGGYGKRRRGKLVEPVKNTELLVHERPNSAMAEAARSIRSNILFTSPDHPPHMILVTSAGAGDGKTTNAIALATSFAQAGARVLVVDLDLRRPRVHRVFGCGSSEGVSSVLVGNCTLEEAIKKTVVPNLSVLPSGPVPPNPAEILLSEKLSTLLHTLRERYDRVIIDSPPINPITDAVILSTRVDGVLLVVRSFKTTVDEIRLAVRSLVDVKAKVLGAVLNAVDLGRLEYKYSYYYRYYGGYTQRPSDTKEERPA